MLAAGQGLDKDPKAALHWFQQAARAGNVDAMHAAGSMLIAGTAGEKDVAAGRAWLQKAADSGKEESREALRRIGP
jgi:TPR repeat protein